MILHVNTWPLHSQAHMHMSTNTYTAVSTHAWTLMHTPHTYTQPRLLLISTHWALELSSTSKGSTPWGTPYHPVPCSFVWLPFCLQWQSIPMTILSDTPSPSHPLQVISLSSLLPEAPSPQTGSLASCKCCCCLWPCLNHLFVWSRFLALFWEVL